MKLSERVNFASYPHIRPICLPSEGFEDYDHTLGIVTGWGNTKAHFIKYGDVVKGYGRGLSDTLQKLNVR